MWESSPKKTHVEAPIIIYPPTAASNILVHDQIRVPFDTFAWYSSVEDLHQMTAPSESTHALGCLNRQDVTQRVSHCFLIELIFHVILLLFYLISTKTRVMSPNMLCRRMMRIDSDVAWPIRGSLEQESYSSTVASCFETFFFWLWQDWWEYLSLVG